VRERPFDRLERRRERGELDTVFADRSRQMVRGDAEQADACMRAALVIDAMDQGAHFADHHAREQCNDREPTPPSGAAR
jgi:hypothetical protein